MRLREGPPASQSTQEPQESGPHKLSALPPEDDISGHTCYLRDGASRLPAPQGTHLFGSHLFCPEPTVQEVLVCMNVIKTQ